MALKYLVGLLLFLAPFVCLSQESNVVEHYLEESRDRGGALFTGSIAGMPIHAVLNIGNEGEIEGFYFYDKFYSRNEYDQNGFTFRPIQLNGTITRADDDSITLSLVDSLHDEQIADINARYFPDDREFRGKWILRSNGKEHAIVLTVGGVLKIYASPRVDLSMSPGSMKLILEDDTRVDVERFYFKDEWCEKCGPPYSFEILDGEPRIFAIREHSSGGRVESVESRYVVEGEHEPFLSAAKGGGHSCAGSHGGRHDHNVEYVSPVFIIEFSSRSWNHCNTENGYFTDNESTKIEAYRIEESVDGEVSIEKIAPGKRRSTSVLTDAGGDAIFIELTDHNLYWGGYARTGRTYDVFQFGGNRAEFGYRCWLYGDGSGLDAPSTGDIDPVWRNLDPVTSWENFRSGNDLLGTKTWTFSTDGKNQDIKLNGVHVARYDMEHNRCYSLYLKHSRPGVAALVSE